VDIQARKRALAEGAIDLLRDRFGKTAVETGYTFGRGRTRHSEPEADSQ
jgi:DNA polymerase-4